jgi:glycosyltransferase involved in cell wall biosynthesis
MIKKISSSIIIPTYNRADLLDLTLQSLVEQAGGTEGFEVLVCDDGSQDNTKEICDAYSSKLNLQYLYQPDEGYRVAKARNMGIKIAEGEICIFLDSGMIVGDDYVRRHVENYIDRGRCAFACDVIGYDANYPKLEDLSKKIELEGAATVLRNGADIYPDLRHDFYLETNFNVDGVPAPWLIYWTGNASARTADLRAVGMFDESIVGWGGEDIDLAYRLYHDGVHIFSDSRASALHFPHASDRDHKIMELSKNYLLLWKKYNDPIFKYILRYGYRAVNLALMREDSLEEVFQFNEDHKVEQFC